MTVDEQTRVAVVGAGAVGGFYGARLVGSGARVAFLARGRNLEALRDRGLTLRAEGEERMLSVQAASTPEEVGPVDVVLLCVRTFDVTETARSLAPLLAPHTVILALQNGLGHIGQITEEVGPDRVLAGSVQALAVQMVAPGVVGHTGGEGEIAFGEPEGGFSKRAERLGELFERAGIPHRLSAEMRRVMWEKFLFIAGVGGVTALARTPIGPLLASREGRALLADSCEEVAAVARAESVNLGNDAIECTLRFAGTFPSGWRSSMARDLEAGRRLEVDALSGTVVRRAEEHGLPVSVHRTIHACLSLHQPDGG